MFSSEAPIPLPIDPGFGGIGLFPFYLVNLLATGSADGGI